ncbi:hypothetical protein JXB37_01815 [candidate division WOR-3 bacterium]|nr:hypothetical protein [candidate division WOR-3 bacterium]
MYLIGLTQLLVPVFGAALIAAGVQGLKAEWRALFRKPMPGALARVIVWLLAIALQLYNWRSHPWVPVWQVPVMAVATAFCAMGIYRFARRSPGA